MIDTIVLTLTSTSFQITQPDKFMPSARWVENYGCAAYGIRSKQNATKKELKRGIYKPRLILSHRHTRTPTKEIILRIELSAPKLVFGNNFDELRPKDFLPLIKKLAATLETMGVIVSTDALAHASVCAIHYSKNIA